MGGLEGVLKILRHRGRHDLARLLERSSLAFIESDTYGTYLFSRLTTAEIFSPIEDCEKLRRLNEKDRASIMGALLEIHPPRDYGIEINHIKFRVDPESPVVEESRDEEFVELLEAQRNLMIAVSTGGPRINTVNAKYQERRERIREALSERGLDDPNPYSDLWAWYGKWSSGDLPSYQSRREYINGLYQPLIERLRKGPHLRGADVFAEPTGWAKVDRSITQIRRQLEQAETEEQFQTVGLLARETLISVAQVAYDPSKHEPTNGVKASNTDAKRMLEAYLNAELSGKTNEIARKHAKASLDLANELTHKRTATFRQAALCAEATSSVVNIIAIISGQRDP